MGGSWAAGASVAGLGPRRDPERSFARGFVGLFEPRVFLPLVSALFGASVTTNKGLGGLLLAEGLVAGPSGLVQGDAREAVPDQGRPVQMKAGARRSRVPWCCQCLRPPSRQ